MSEREARDGLERARDLRAREVAAELGISRDLLYALVEEGHFRGCYRLGGRRELRFPRAVIDAYKAENQVHS